jgi:acetyl esterase/lipase
VLAVVGGASVLLFVGPVILFVALGGFSSEPSEAILRSSISPGLELRPISYRAARHRFKTKLVLHGPAPQEWNQSSPPEGVSEVLFPSGDLQLKAWITRCPDSGGKRPAVLFLHGGFAFAAEDWEQAQPFVEAGFVLMMPSLRGENGQDGSFSMFFDEVDDALAASSSLANVPCVDRSRIFVAGHSAGGTLAMLASMSTKTFRAAASFSGAPDNVAFVDSGLEAPFDRNDPQEFIVRSPVAYATSFQCPARLYYGSQEEFFDLPTQETARRARTTGLDVEAVRVDGDHFSAVPEAMEQAITFFEQQMSGSTR